MFSCPCSCAMLLMVKHAYDLLFYRGHAHTAQAHFRSLLNSLPLDCNRYYSIIGGDALFMAHEHILCSRLPFTISSFKAVYLKNVYFFHFSSTIEKQIEFDFEAMYRIFYVFSMFNVHIDFRLVLSISNCFDWFCSLALAFFDGRLNKFTSCSNWFNDGDFRPMCVCAFCIFCSKLTCILGYNQQWQLTIKSVDEYSKSHNEIFHLFVNIITKNMFGADNKTRHCLHSASI